MRNGRTFWGNEPPGHERAAPDCGAHGVAYRAAGTHGQGWERRGKPEKEAWESDAELYVSLYHSSQAMIWVDPSLHVRWVAPLTGNETAQDFDLGFEEQRRRTLELVGGKRTAMITRALGSVGTRQDSRFLSPLRGQ